MGGDAGLVVREVGNDVSPAFEVVDAKDDKEVFAGVSDEAKTTGATATAHGEDLITIDVVPGAGGVVPNGLFDDAEGDVLVFVVMDDTGSDDVRHAEEKG